MLIVNWRKTEVRSANKPIINNPADVMGLVIGIKIQSATILLMSRDWWSVSKSNQQLPCWCHGIGDRCQKPIINYPADVMGLVIGAKSQSSTTLLMSWDWWSVPLRCDLTQSFVTSMWLDTIVCDFDVTWHNRLWLILVHNFALRVAKYYAFRRHNFY